MQTPKTSVAFDKEHAAKYDAQFAALSPLRDALHLQTRAILGDLPADARVLCVGAGTGAELLHLADAFPGWHFTAVEPSGAMLDVCRGHAETRGITSRCTFHEGYLDSLPASQPFDAATSFLVSQFLLDQDERRAFFAGIAQRLRPGGRLLSTDLTSDTASPEYAALLEEWLKLIAFTGADPEKLEQMRVVYSRDVGILPAGRVEALIASAGFETPVRFYQSMLIHGWFARRAA